MLAMAVGLVLAFVALAQAQDMREERVHFAAGKSGTTIKGRIRARQTVDYVLGASGGQRISIDFSTSNPSGYFNLLPAGSETAIHVGSIAGNSYEGILPASGDYRIRVYLMRSAARRNETMNYSLSVTIGGAQSGGGGGSDYADGLAGGPDFWEVTGVPAGDTLNVRAGAGTGNAVVGELANGDVARNLGCRMVGKSRWCRIEAGTEQKFAGWVNGHYLREASGGPRDGSVNSEATGEVPCSTTLGQPTGRCPFRVSRGGGGNASVWIALPSGGERYVRFRSGEPITSEAGLEVTYERSGDLYLIRVNDTERYEIPDAVVFGG